MTQNKIKICYVHIHHNDVKGTALVQAASFNFFLQRERFSDRPTKISLHHSEWEESIDVKRKNRSGSTHIHFKVLKRYHQLFSIMY